MGRIVASVRIENLAETESQIHGAMPSSGHLAASYMVLPSAAWLETGWGIFEEIREGFSRKPPGAGRVVEGTICGPVRIHIEVVSARSSNEVLFLDMQPGQWPLRAADRLHHPGAGAGGGGHVGPPPCSSQEHGLEIDRATSIPIGPALLLPPFGRARRFAFCRGATSRIPWRSWESACCKRSSNGSTRNEPCLPGTRFATRRKTYYFPGCFPSAFFFVASANSVSQ